MPLSRLAIIAVIASLLLNAPLTFAASKKKRSDSTASKEASESTSGENANESLAARLTKSEDKEKDKEKGERDKDGERSTRSSISEIMDKLDYPELQVVPRASERLKIEANDERYSWYWTHWQIELSGLATAYTGVVGRSQLRSELSDAERTNAGSIATVAEAVGAGWVLAGVLVGLQHPYRAGLNSITKYEGKDTRSALMRERLSEEALEKPARLMRPLRWASVITNLTMCLAMGRYMTDEGRITAGVSAFLAFLPVMYDDHNIRVFEKHLEYKAKIYGPLTSVGPMYRPESRSFAPVASLTWNF
jgi:hypothetical protein